MINIGFFLIYLTIFMMMLSSYLSYLYYVVMYSIVRKHRKVLIVLGAFIIVFYTYLMCVEIQLT